MIPVIYLIKVNLAVALCYLVYLLFFRNDTFFRGKRMLLLSMLAFSLAYPFITVMENMVSRLFVKDLSGIVQIGDIFLEEVSVSEIPVNETVKTDYLKYLPTILSSIYLAGLIIMIIRLLAQIISFGIMIFKSRRVETEGRKIYLKSGLKTPFSFFGLIFVDPAMHNQLEMKEIIRHEGAHTEQFHSFDALFSEIVCALCWFNPMAWLIKHELRMNLEYLADRSVIESGCNSEHYQFHLLHLTYNKAIAQITNNFNFSPLKKRIIMINKKKTSEKSRAKYLLILPLCLSLLIINGFPVRGNDSQAEPVAAPVPPQDKAIVYQHVETMPEFQGGTTALMQWLNKNLEYPVEAQEKKAQGTVTVRFIVGADGTVREPQIAKSADNEALDKEAIRVFESMPKWIPGKQNGQNVDVYFNLPIRFRMQDNNEKAKDGANIPPPPPLAKTKTNVTFMLDGKSVSSAVFAENCDEGASQVKITKNEDGSKTVVISGKSK